MFLNYRRFLWYGKKFGYLKILEENSWCWIYVLCSFLKILSGISLGTYKATKLKLFYVRHSSASWWSPHSPTCTQMHTWSPTDRGKEGQGSEIIGEREKLVRAHLSSLVHIVSSNCIFFNSLYWDSVLYLIISIFNFAAAVPNLAMVESVDDEKVILYLVSLLLMPHTILQRTGLICICR